MPKLSRTTYRVELEGEELFEVTPILRDILRGELEGPKHGINNPAAQSIHTTLLWIWSAAVADGHFAGGFREFRDACTNFETVKPAPTDLEVQGVPPTSAASPSEPHSLSLVDSATPKPPKRGSRSSRPPAPAE